VRSEKRDHRERERSHPGGTFLFYIPSRGRGDVPADVRIRRVRERTVELIRANFLIAVSPQRPQIEYADRLILPGSNVTARAGEIATLTCRARYGNPSPLIKWFVIVARRFRRLYLTCAAPSLSFHRPRRDVPPLRRPSLLPLLPDR